MGDPYTIPDIPLETKLELKVTPPCFEIEILVTLENYFMAGEKECGGLYSVSDVYELALKPPPRENFTYAHRLQLRIIVVIVWPRL